MITQLYYPILCFTTVTLLSLVTLYLFIMKRRFWKIQKSLHDLQESHEQLVMALESEKREEQTSEHFNIRLARAELTTNLQGPRLFCRHLSGKPEAPERYDYIQTMSEKGMPPQEIASLLSMSPYETDQLVRLSKLARRHNDLYAEKPDCSATCLKAA